MSNISVTVAGLNKRSVINVNGPSAPLYQILDDFCKKFGLETSKYELLMTRKPMGKKSRKLDLSLPWRLSGLNNHTELEVALKKSTSGTKNAGKATIGFQLHDGRRFKEVIPLDYTLWQCLRLLERNHVEEKVNVTQVVKLSSRLYCIPVITAMNNSYDTLETLGNTTLSSLGLSDNGNILFRITFKETDKTFEEMVPTIVNLNKNAPFSTETQTPEPVIAESNVPFEQGTLVQLEPSIETVESTQTTNKKQEIEEDLEGGEEIKGIDLENTVATNIKLYFTPHHAEIKEEDDDIAEEDFEMTAEDLKKILSEQERRKEDQSILKTRKMRELEMEKKKRVYEHVLIRIRFPTIDGLIIQGTFKPTHTFSDVHNFVLQVLSDPQTPFYMYIAPPVKKFTQEHMGKTLQELGLVPAAIVNINVDRNNPASQTHNELTIKNDLLQHLQRITSDYVPKNINKPIEQGNEQSQLPQRSSDNVPKKPKWFKP